MALQAVNPVLAKSAEEKRDEKTADIPRCSKKIGTASIVEPENQWWREIEGGLGSPEALIRIFIRQSGCFTLVNRGRGFDAAMQERDLASSGQLRGGSNVGKGQIKTADYIIVPDIVTRNSNKGGTNVGGIIGGLFGGAAGAILGGISLKKRSANVILYVTDTRSSEEVAATEGRAEKRDLGWGAGGGLFAGGFLVLAAPAAMPIRKSARSWRSPTSTPTRRWSVNWAACRTAHRRRMSSRRFRSRSRASSTPIRPSRVK
ncbi:CsgG/HfaB family protein [Hankyongella ginsenosidimutans]|uniref:CsgG/HfaB family protein n=1 Tax=Hankyongella ginsenosidimutans TaxID=1763828 RepID=UPI001FE45B54|nr:CsgG/HfaB family protein [Hankyongella ginsenosidimutans]